MKRIFRLSTLAVALVAAVWLASLSPVAQREANADPLYRGYYYGGGYAPGDGRYSGFGYTGGYSGYGYTSSYGYADPVPGRPVTPSYRAYGLGNGFGTGGTYRGMYYGNNVDHAYGGSRFYAQPPYNPYGYGPYGFRVQHDYGY
jgi:hypothetical protein